MENLNKDLSRRIIISQSICISMKNAFQKIQENNELDAKAIINEYSEWFSDKKLITGIINIDSVLTCKYGQIN